MNNVYYEKISFPIPVNGMDDCYIRIVNCEDSRNDTTLHWHNSVEIVLVIEGSVQFVVDGIYRTTNSGHFHLINSNSIHAATKKNPVGRIHTLILELSDRYLNKALPDSTPCAFEIIEESDSYQEILETLNQIVFFVNDNSPFSQLAIASLANKILYILFKNCQIPISENRGFSKKVLSYIDQNYHKPLHLEDIADFAGFQKNYFCRLFKKETGISFKYYLNYVRLNSALSLFADKQGTALECALCSGFSSEKAMIEWCRKIYGCTPTSYVRQVRK